MDAGERRNLAKHARQLAALMHQPNVSQQFMAQADLLEEEAKVLGDGADIADPGRAGPQSSSRTG